MAHARAASVRCRYWPFGGPFCLAWATADILTCTASILHLCAIAVDRYRAIHSPVAYAQKRTVRRVLLTVCAVWTVSALISIPPLLGWSDAGGLFDATTRQCQLTDDPGFVLYSASGSFYIPLVVMWVVYVKIFLAVRARLRARASSSLVTIGMTNVALATAVTGKQRGAECERRGREEEREREDGDGEADEGEDGGLESRRRLRRSLANGLSPRRFREMLAESTRRYGSTNRLADDDDDAAGGGGGGGSQRVNAGTGSHLTQFGDGNLTQFLAEKQRISLSRERRAARTMTVVMGAFVLCWLPFFLMYVALAFCRRCRDDIDARVVNLIVWLGYVNSTLNPLIYTVFNVDFRRAFSQLLRPNCRRRVAL